MKPKDLKSVFTWEERRPLIKDKILYVPEYYFEHEKFVMPTLDTIFHNTNPVNLEYCSGNGDWIIERAKADPSKNWIGVEKQFKRVKKIWSKRENQGLKNLLIVCGEAHTFSKYYLHDNSIDSSYINFPDPWPKDKHAKNRLIKSLFLDELTRVLKHSSTLTVVTDDCDYKEQVINTCLDHDMFSSSHPEPYFITDLEDYGYSYFHDLWKRLGRTIHHMNFINKKNEFACLPS